MMTAAASPATPTKVLAVSEGAILDSTTPLDETTDASDECASSEESANEESRCEPPMTVAPPTPCEAPVVDEGDEGWSTVPTKASRRSMRKTEEGLAVPDAGNAPGPGALARPQCGAHPDNVAEIYYDRKELFQRGFASGAKASRNEKQRKKTAYTVNKRQQQSLRDRGLLCDED